MAAPKHGHFTFDEFYRAFSRSVDVPPDKTCPDAQIQHSSNACRVIRSPRMLPVAVHDVKQQRPRPHSSPKPEVVLPEYLAALVELQEPDGSWTYSPELQYSLHGVVSPLPPEQSHKVWATAICIHVWRQFPESFPQLEPHYDKAMLHADESVLQRVKPLIDFASLRKIRRYNSDDARAMRERLAKEAAAKRAQEDDEYWEQVHAREREARRLPMKTQTHLVKGLRCEVDDVFHAHHSGAFHVDEIVESCWRRASRSGHAERQDVWHPCQITAVLKTDDNTSDTSHRTYNIVFLDGDREREHRVLPKYLRRCADDDRAVRSTAFEKLRATWQEPIACRDEVLRLHQLYAMKTKPKPWNASSSYSQPLLPALVREPRPSSPVDPPLVFSARNRAASLLLASSGTLQVDPGRFDANKDNEDETQFLLYRDRFHAFDAFTSALVALMQCTVDALERISDWKKTRCVNKKSKGKKSSKAIFVWNGQNFVVMLSRSLDLLAHHRELVEWYGEEFPLELNPFMRAKSLADTAEDMGFVVASGGHHVNTLRAVLKLHAKDPSEVSTPTWWPESQYDDELRTRLDRAEQFVIQELLAAGFLVGAT
ncbi:hypothetical protein FI667_g3855, partial [Globisporangium splendens]